MKTIELQLAKPKEANAKLSKEEKFWLIDKLLRDSLNELNNQIHVLHELQKKMDKKANTQGKNIKNLAMFIMVVVNISTGPLPFLLPYPTGIITFVILSIFGLLICAAGRAYQKHMFSQLRQTIVLLNEGHTILSHGWETQKTFRNAPRDTRYDKQSQVVKYSKKIESTINTMHRFIESRVSPNDKIYHTGFSQSFHHSARTLSLTPSLTPTRSLYP